MNRNNWNSKDRHSKYERGKFSRPRGLRGKEIGMFYRNLRIKNNGKQQKQVINLKIPPAILRGIKHNLSSLENLAAKNRVNLPQTTRTIEMLGPKNISNNISEQKEELLDDIELNEGFMVTPRYVQSTMTKVKCEPSNSNNISTKLDNQTQNLQTSNFVPNLEPCTSKSLDFIQIETNSYDRKPKLKDHNLFNVFDSTSFKSESCNEETIRIKDDPDTFNTPDFIPLNTEQQREPKEYLSYSNDLVTDRLLSFRGSGDYKYGYEDIIKGSFNEKLDESLLKGIDIAVVNSETNDLSFALNEELKDMVTKERYKSMMRFRETLPTFKKSKELLDIISNNQVVVISGETGCGKSTQVPQLILDDAIRNKRGANVKILVTQPRRIAASSLADRVADERAEKLGNSVGYAVRLEKVDPRPRGSILYCTTGILLTDLEINQGLTNYSHVILDEVHERDCHIDLSMCMLKEVLKKRKDLKLILMSATIDADRLSTYFDNCPMMHIEGLAYPVKDVYLEEILDMIKFKLPPADNNFGRNEPKWKKHTRKFKEAAAGEMQKDILYKQEISGWLESIKNKLNRDVYNTLKDSRIEKLNYDLMVQLLINICKGEPGAILVFLPGIGEITKIMRKMNESGVFPNNNYDIYPLHSKLPTLEQHAIFQRPPKNKRKIIIATNIAETSITIDDIVYVVDCGMIKLSGLNIEEHLSTLKVEWASQANLRQRRGRAGRCQPGICYHLLTSYRAEQLPFRLLPELQRSNLLEPVLTIKRLRLGKALDALMMVPDPPDQSTVEKSVKHLKQCGALDDKETLTPLGWHLARLPVHPAAGKLLVLGALFGCLDRAASVAAVWSFKDPFLLVIDKETEIKKAKRMLALGEPSDHVAISEAIIQWEQRPRHSKKSFAYDNFLSNSTLELLSAMKDQLGDNLRNMGFLSRSDVKSSWENRNTDNLSLFKAIVAASLYPNIACVQWKHLHNFRRNPSIAVRTPDNQYICVHPSSVMTSPRGPGSAKLCDKPGANWLVYWLKQRSSDLFLIDVTLVYTLPLLFFGELLVTHAEPENPQDCFISITSVNVRCKKETADLLFQLRMMLDYVLATKVVTCNCHSTRHDEFEELVLNAVIQLITAEDEQAEYLSVEFSDSDTSESDTSWNRHR